MAKILITSGPTRQYLDPVRYLTNASSGKMGHALAVAAIEFGHDVNVVSGPVNIDYPPPAKVVQIETTLQMLDACHRIFADCDGAIGAAAPCDYKPERVSDEKLAKTGEPLVLHLIETSDVIASLGEVKKESQWLVGFALETNDARFRAITKMQKKSCDMMVFNDPSAIDSEFNTVELLHKSENLIAKVQGDKLTVAKRIMQEIQDNLI